MDPLSLAVCATAFTAELFYGLSTFGVAITFHIGFHLAYLGGLTEATVQEVVFSLAAPEVAVGLVQSLLLWRSCAWRLLLVAVLCYSAAWVLGTVALLTVGTSVWLKRGLGLLLLSMTFAHFCRRRCQPTAAAAAATTPASPAPPPLGSVPDLSQPRVLLLAAGCFSASGGLGGLTGVAGPPMMVFVIANAGVLNMHTWRSTSALLRLSVACGRLTFFTATGKLGLDSAQAWQRQLLVVTGALAGLGVGNRLARHVEHGTFQNLVGLFLACGSALLVTADMREPLNVELAAVWGIVAVFPLAGAYSFWNRLRWRAVGLCEALAKASGRGGLRGSVLRDQAIEVSLTRNVSLLASISKSNAESCTV